MPRAPTPLWPVPLLVATIPFVAAHLAYALSIDAGHVPACVPYVEGCTSISRAARHGLGNHLFRLLMLPSALLLALHWLAARAWLRQRHADPRAGRNLPLLGAFGGLALATYVAFLGTEGEVYRWLRQNGAQLYFASVYVAQLVFLHRYRQTAGYDRRIVAGMLAISLGMLAMGIGYTAVANAWADEALKDRMENLLEWHIGLAMTVWYFLQARIWRLSAFSLSFDAR
ncbi:MAG: hypothetical protein ACOY82_17465 [Pseudomonadota bacterium]